MATVLRVLKVLRVFIRENSFEGFKGFDGFDGILFEEIALRVLLHKVTKVHFMNML